MSKTFRGIYDILVTPFNDQGDLVWEDFDTEADFIARSGAHGLVWPVMASSFTVISHDERIQGMKRAVDTVAGRIPVVIGVADTSRAGAARFAAEAGKAGADAIIAMPPWVAAKMTSHALIEDYFRALAGESGLPIMIQNAGAPLGSALAAPFVVELCEKIDLVQYVKEEKPPQGRSVSELIDMKSPAVKGVFSGASALYIISEYARGVCGNMPACVLPDIDGEIWDALEAGNGERARELMAAKANFENCLHSMPPGVRNEVLRRRGAIQHTAARNTGPLVLDAVDLKELDYAMSLVAPYFRV